MREFLRDLLPPIVARAYRSAAGRAFSFCGDYGSWEAARAASSGYDAAEILDRTREAALKVKSGEAQMDRDAVAFDRMEFPFAVLAGLLRAACAKKGSLVVLDIGGAFGNSYRQARAFAAQPALRWNVVEQPALVASAREHFESDELRFFSGVAEALAAGPADVVLLSSALQYFEEPYTLLEELGKIDAASLIIDRTPCSDAERDVLAVQTVPAEIYSGSYPCWIFSRRRLEAALAKRYAVVSAFGDPAGPQRSDCGAFELQGYVLDRRN